MGELTATLMSTVDPIPLVRPPPAGGRFRPGMSIAGRYRLHRYLARGGMAEVWAAEHEGLRSEVAIKFVDAALASDATTAPYALERFRFEAQISAKISAKTRHVVGVHDAGEHEGAPYLVMELVHGHTLEEEIERKGRLPIERFARVLDQVADALEAAHALGIVHRDLKPSNLMIVDEADGGLLVKLADFGVAKSLRFDATIDRPRETVQGELVGSPAFMSPEQIVGDTRVDARTDLWSLGVVAYEALTGGSCFEGATIPQLMVAITKGVYRPPSTVRPDLPASTDAFFATALASRPEDRFPSARAFAAAFRALLAPPSRSRRGVVRLAALAVAIAIALGITALAIFTRHPSDPPSTPAPTARIVAPPPDVAPPVTVPPAPSVAPAPSTTSRPSPTSRVKATPSAAPVVAPVVTSKAAAPAPTVEPPRPRKKIDPSEIQ